MDYDGKRMVRIEIKINLLIINRVAINALSAISWEVGYRRTD